MKESKQTINRRKFLPFLSGSFLLALFGFTTAKIPTEKEEYKTVITKDGKAVRVRARVLQESKTLDKKLSNKNLLSWLQKDNINPWSK